MATMPENFARGSSDKTLRAFITDAHDPSLLLRIQVQFWINWQT
jgi:hypothetical protein